MDCGLSRRQMFKQRFDSRPIPSNRIEQRQTLCRRNAAYVWTDEEAPVRNGYRYLNNRLDCLAYPRALRLGLPVDDRVRRQSRSSSESVVDEWVVSPRRHLQNRGDEQRDERRRACR